MRISRSSYGALLAALAWGPQAHALTAEVPEREPSLVGDVASFHAAASDTTGVTEYRWDFGDGTRTEFVADQTDVEHEYAAPGHYSVIVLVKDELGYTSVGFTHTVHYPLLPQRPVSSTSIVYDEGRHLVWCVNPDSDTITAIDADALQKVVEIPVYRRPHALAFAPDGTLWVVHRDDYAVAVINPDTRAIERGFRLPYASQPVSLAMSPSADAAYVTLMALGKLLKLDPSTGDVLGELDVGPWPRGLSISSDGNSAYVTRFISPDKFAEVVQVDNPSLQVVQRFQLAEDTTTADTDQKGRGLANYLFSVTLSPDGKEAWVPSKKDNMSRGLQRDGLELSQDNMVRPLVSVIDLVGGAEAVESRMDLDDRSLPSHVEFSPLGDYAFVTVTGSNLIEVRDRYKKSFVTALRNAGRAPLGTVLGPDGRLFVHGFLSRSVVVYDAADIVASLDFTTRQVAEIPTVENELLAPDVLLGKQIFYDAEDSRMSQEGYLSCSVCHFDGFEDGRVWDHTDRGEGIRNTTSMLGRRGTGQGRVHWSANFDEIQDFEGIIRAKFSGSGFMANDLFQEGTRSNPLGDPMAGLSPELDALAAYLTSLDHVNPSPYRNPDGTMTAAALEGKELFARHLCGNCHLGDDFTDSAAEAVHDVGTLKPSSGMRLGGPLTGIDTPTLLGVWETAPYFHDGRAATLYDALSPELSSGEMGAVPPEDVESLVAYLRELDNGLPPRRLPFEPEPKPEERADASSEGLCAVAAPGATRDTPRWALWIASVLALAVARRRRAT
jgi:DNA-binding beta-propeller fold protein YncE